MSPNRRHALNVLKAALCLGLLALAVWTNRGPLCDVFTRSIDVRLFVLGFAFYAGGMLLAYVRWFLLVRALDLPFRRRDAVRLGLIGSFFSLVIPGAIGGEFVKAAYLCRQQQSHAGPIASVVLNTLVGLVGLFVLAALVGTPSWGTLDGPTRNIVVAAWIATGVVLGVIGLAFVPWRGRGPGKVSGLAAVGRSYRRRFGVVLLGMVMATATHSLNVLAFYAVSRALFPSVPALAEHFLIVPLVLFSTAIPLPLGALGAAEEVSQALFRLADYSGGGVAMMGFRTLQFGLATIGALVYLANRREVRDLRERARALEEEAEGLSPAASPAAR